MRDALLAMFCAALLAVIMTTPHVGALAYAWFSLMNPHRLTYGFAYTLPLAFAFAVATIAAWILSDERKLPDMTLLAWWLVLFGIWICVTTWSALVPEPAMEKFDRVIKNLIAVFVTLVLIDRRSRLTQLVWVVTLSIVIFGVKGGIFTILTGGSHRVWGPPASMIADNNTLALALVMVLPLLYHLCRQAPHPWLRRGLYVALGLTLVAIVGTQSRGGMLALGAMGVLFWWRAPHKLAFALIGLSVAALVGWLMFDVIVERLSTLQDVDADASAQGRFEAWAFALKIVEEHPWTGGGFFVFTLNEQIIEGELGYLNAHSIYFEVLGEHGYVGLVLFVGLILGCLISCARVMRTTAGREDLHWAHDLASSLQLATIGYAVGGAFLTMAFYDLFYYFLAIAVINQTVVRAILEQERYEARIRSARLFAEHRRSLRYHTPVRALAPAFVPTARD
ncbi:MAG: putative O-glycosylation ligase, exosortase A system-associated [Geminicoccaceae bacterium]|nr:putative O-glycosylation ligase, exosortase A system-associated [Geminicoccaceae bacterium]